MLFVNILLLILGFFALVKGADFFVEGASGIAKKFGIPSLIIGLTIVAFGTSAPEASVSIIASINKSNELALSNVIGSNLFNILVVLGICSIIKSLPVDRNTIKRDLPISILGTMITFIISKSFLVFKYNINNTDKIIGVIPRYASILLLVIFVLYILFLIINAYKSLDKTSSKSQQNTIKILALTIIGLALIIIGGKVTVDSAKYIASYLGMSETLIGLSIVAIGTSLPELVTSIVATKKGEIELAVGNVVGSNIFNLLFIIGMSSLINPINVNIASAIDLVLLIIITVTALIFSKTKNIIDKKEGLFMIIVYILEMTFAIIR